MIPPIILLVALTTYLRGQMGGAGGREEGRGGGGVLHLKSVLVRA